MTEIRIKEWMEEKDKPSVSQVKAYFHKLGEKTDQVENAALLIGQEVANQIDCLKCANCCKTTVTNFKEADIHNAANYLGISKEAFIKKYLINDFGEYVTITTPCPFLLEDNKCKIYEVRPEACNSYPHVHKKGFLQRKKAHIHNYKICPITFHTVNRIMEHCDLK